MEGLPHQAVEGDARAVSIHLTTQGRALTERIIPAAQLYEATALEGLTGDEARLLKALLGRLFNNMGALAGKSRAAARIAS